METNEAAWEVLATPTKPRLRNLCWRFIAMSELYHAIQLPLFLSSPIEHVSPDCACVGKECSKCEQLRCCGYFYRNTQSKDKLRPECRFCGKAEYSTEAFRAKRRESYRKKAEEKRRNNPPKERVSDEQLIESYTRTNNVWKTGEEFGITGQTVHTRLTKLSVIHKMRVLTDEERILIEEVYASGILNGDGKLQSLSQKIGRTIPTISHYAKILGLTVYRRPPTENGKRATSQRNKEWIARNGHPRGMLDKHHSDKMKKQMSQRTQEMWEDPESKFNTEEFRERRAKINLEIAHKRIYEKPESIYSRTTKGWREFPDGKRYFFRSKWEINYSYYLEWLKGRGEIKDWSYEEDTFWFEDIKRGVRSYLPDFKIWENSGDIRYVEVKGWMDDKSKTKLSRMAKYYPHVKLEVFGEDEYKELKKMGALFGWE